MSHLKYDQMRKNAEAAIPDFDELTLGMTAIFKRQDKPRLPQHELEVLIEQLIEKGDVEVIQVYLSENRPIDQYRWRKS